jgi:hypothetical protein
LLEAAYDAGRDGGILTEIVAAVEDLRIASALIFVHHAVMETSSW